MGRTKHPARVLIIATNTPAYELAGYRTGLWLGELTHFYDVLADAGHDLTIASVSGGLVPLDPESLAAPVLKLGRTDKRYEDPAFMGLLEDTPSVEDVADEHWDAVYLTGFSWAEEKLAGRDKVVPFRLDKALKDEGATYTKALLPMTEKVVEDGRLVTGQNPMSAAGVAKAVVKLLKKQHRH